MNRGIDPATHRPINETTPSREATTISFAPAETKITPCRERDEPKMATLRFGCKQEEEEGEVVDRLGREDQLVGEERCPDLNLELRISPPSQPQQGGGKRPGPGTGWEKLFTKVKNGSSECSAGYDFLGLKQGVLDYGG